jgi:hypothetical protein
MRRSLFDVMSDGKGRLAFWVAWTVIMVACVAFWVFAYHVLMAVLP